MRAKKVVTFAVAAIVFGLIVLAGFGQAVHYLWNWLMPEIFGLHTITYWQAVGLLGLSWLLFGGTHWFGGPRRRSSRGEHFLRQWAKMTPEERATFREAMRNRCGPKGPMEEQHS